MTPPPPDSGRGDDLPLPEALLPEALAAAITMAGPMSIAQFMGAANTHYYATRDPLGASGDFVTAPEISQMFGELIGLWAADLWDRAGRPDVAWVELGPGRGTVRCMHTTRPGSAFANPLSLLLPRQRLLRLFTPSAGHDAVHASDSNHRAHVRCTTFVGMT